MRGTIKIEYQNFIKEQVSQGFSAADIKKKLDDIYCRNNNDVPSLASVKRYATVFKVEASGNAINTHLGKNTIDKKYQKFIHDRLQQGKSNIEIRDELRREYGKKSVNVTTIYTWIRRFRAAAVNAINTTNDQSTNEPSDSDSTFVEEATRLEAIREASNKLSVRPRLGALARQHRLIIDEHKKYSNVEIANRARSEESNPDYNLFKYATKTTKEADHRGSYLVPNAKTTIQQVIYFFNNE